MQFEHQPCRRLVAAGMLPDRAGQPTQVQLHLTLAQLRGTPGASAAEAAWAAHRATQPGWLTGPAAGAATCDATVVPVVTGHVDWAALDRLTEVYLAIKGLSPTGTAGHAAAPASGSQTRSKAGMATSGPAATEPGGAGPAGAVGSAGITGVAETRGQAAGAAGCGCTCGGCTCPARIPLSPATLARLRVTMLRLAADVLSGPAGLASWLRHAQLTGTPGGSPSLPLAVPLPLDTGDAEPTTPDGTRTLHDHDPPAEAA